MRLVTRTAKFTKRRPLSNLREHHCPMGFGRKIRADSMNDRVLFVDDDVNLLASFRRQFGREFQLETAGDGTEAIRILSEKGPFAVVVSDLRMPGMSGLELLREIKDKHRTPPPVVMMITAYGDAENYQAAMKLGADDFLTKPLDFSTLKEKLKSLN
mgnify:CR=1 FL=1